ncbi:winged helix-turn-helix domain-containing protein [Streptosporangium lutulentum]
MCRLSADQLERLAWELERGPAAHGWSDQRWTLPRIAAVIREVFRVSYTARGVAYLLRGRGWSPQVPVHRATERDEEQITAWKGWRWSALKEPRRLGTPGSSSATNQARVSRPPKGRTWARRGHTPIVAVPGRGTGRVSIAGLLWSSRGSGPG